MIKITWVEYKKVTPRGIDKNAFVNFVQYVAESGNSIYTVNGNLSTKEEGNAMYIDLLKKHPNATIEKDTIVTTDEEIIEKLESYIDKYTQYIDDYNQQKEAEKNNDKIRNLISEFEKVAFI